MEAVTRIPLLASLPKTELARLVSDLEEFSFPAGTHVPTETESQGWLYFVLHGEMALVSADTPDDLPVVLLGRGDMFGESTLYANPPGQLHAKSLTDVKLCRIPGPKWKRLLRSDPNLMESFVELLVARLSGTLQDLARSKFMLMAYTDAIWTDVPTPAPSEAVAVMPEVISGQTVHAPTAVRTPWLKTAVGRWISVGATVALSAAVYRFHGGEHKLAAATAILLWATLNWLLDAIPDHVVGLATGILLVITNTVTPAVAFAGFSSPSWFLLVGAGGLGVAVTRSGLLYRIALQMLRRLPPTYLGQSLALALTGLIFTPLLPSANSRMAMASPLARELSDTMRLPHRGRGSAGMAMATFLGFGLVYFIFLNGANTSLLAWSLLPTAVRGNITWTSWLVTALPMGLLIFLACFVAIHLLFRPEPTNGVTRQTIEAQLKILGPMTRMERTTAWVLCAVLVGFVTQNWHGVDAAWMAMGGFLVLASAGVVDKNSVGKIDWRFLLLFGTLVSVSEVTKVTGLSDQLSHWIRPVLLPLGSSPYLFFFGIALLTLIVRLMIPLQTTVLVMVVSLLPVANQMGYNPILVALIVLALSNTWIVPQQNSMYMTVHSGTDEAFTHAQARSLAYVHAAAGLLSVLISIPIWQWIGLVPR